MPRFAGTVLPSLPPLADDYVVTVCAACKHRFCLLLCKRCDSRKNGDPGELKLTVAELRAGGSQEHHSYWRHEEGDNFDMPKSIEDLAELATVMRARPDHPRFIASGLNPADLFAGYIIHELGLDATQCRDVLRDVWPEASKSIDENILAEAG